MHVYKHLHDRVVQFYTFQLTYPAAIGAAAYVVSVIFNDHEGLLSPYFAAFMAVCIFAYVYVCVLIDKCDKFPSYTLQVWSTIFMSGWRHRQATLAMKWFVDIYVGFAVVTEW